MLSTGRPLSGQFGSRGRATLIASVLCALALLALPALAGANGTIRVVKGGDRVLGNTTTSGYASGLSGVTFEYTTDAAKAANPASTGWTAFSATTNGSGVATQSVPAGTYYVREATAGTGFGAFGAVKSLRYSPLTSNPSADQPYAARVTITNNTTTDVSPNTNAEPDATDWDTTSGGSAASSPFINVRDNPLFPDSCGLNILLVLDRSGSIGGSETSYANAAKAFVNSLNGTPSQIGIMSFSAGADASQNSFYTTGVNSYQDGSGDATRTRAPLSLATPGNAALLNSTIDNVYNNVGGGTNWDLALQKASQAAGFTTDIATGQTTKPDLVAFITDGNPTARSTAGTDSGSQVELIDLTAGMSSANSVKNVTARGTTKVKMYALGVGSGVTSENLKVVSGPTAGEDYDTPTIAALQAKLQEVAARTCGARIVVRKTLLGAGVDTTPQTGWNYTATSPSTVSYSDPDNAAPYSTHGNPAQLTVSLNNVPVAGTTAQVTEDAAGQPLPPAEYAYTSTECRLKDSPGWDSNNPFTTGTIVGSAVARGISLTGIIRGSDYYCTTTNTKQKPVVTLTKTAANSPINAGENAVFTITASNAGPGTATGVTVTDDLPAGYTWSENSADCSINTAPNPDELTCNFGSINAGANKSVTLTAATTFATCTTINNTASATTTNTDPIPNANASIVCRPPAVTTTKTAANSPINAGENAVFTITTTNSGLPGTGTATGVTVTDDLPPGYTWSENSTDCSINTAPNPDVLTCNFGTLAPGASKAVTLTAATTFATCTTINNVAKTTGTNTGTIPNANASIVCRPPAVTTTKTASNSPINAGENAVFTITTTNSGLPGTGTATGVVVTDDLPAGYTWSENSTDCSIDTAPNPDKLTCTYPTLAPGASKAVTLTAATTFATCATINNVAKTTGTNTGSIPDANASIVCRPPAVTTTKTAANSPINAGENAVFTITTSNAGPGTATGVVVSDTLPAGYTWSENSADCSITAGVLTCNFGTIASGANKAVTLTAPTTATACATINNVASTTGTNTGSIPNANASIVCQKPNVTVDKTPDNQTISAGTDAEFTITVNNAGPGVAKSVTLSDPLPAGGNWSISQAVNAGTCAITGAVGAQVLNCTFGDLASGATRTLKIKSATGVGACGVYDNTATATSTNNDPGSVNNSGKITCQAPGLAVNKTPDNQTIDAGDDAEFTLTLTNNGPGVATGATLSDPLPANGNWSISDPVNAGTCAITGAVGAQVLNCTFGDLASGATRTLKVKSATSATSCGVYDNTATGRATNTADVTNSGKITCRKPSVKVTKTPNDQTIDAGDDAEFTITVENEGPGVAKSVTLSDPLPANGNWSISQAVNAGTCAITGAVGSQTLDCTFGDLASGATRTLKVKSATSATSCGVYDNTATASSTNNDPATVNDSGKISCRKPSVKVTKTPNDQTIDAGDDAEFTITVENEGPGVAKSVTLSDPLPANGNWSISQAVNAGTCAITGAVGSQTLDCTFGDLASGATRTLKVKSATSATSCGVYDNTATASSTNNDPATVNDSGKITCNAPDLDVVKTADDASVSAGSAIGFTITTTNNGPGTAKSVTLNDPLPNGVTWSIDPANADCAITGTGDDQELDCTFGDLGDDASESVHVTATTAFDACTTYDNEATAKSTNAPDAKDDATVTCLKPDLTVEKTADAATVNAGEAIGFTITATNNGPGTAKSVTLNDPLPNGVDWSIDPANADCAITGTGDDQELDCTFGDLADDASRTVHVTATTAFDACGIYNNEATAKSTNHPDAKDDATVQCLKPNLKVTKTADAATVDAGDPIGFTVTVSNEGAGTAKSVTINDPLPNGVDWTISPANTDCQITGTGDDQVLTCAFGDLEEGQSGQVHITATTSETACTTYDNEATAKSTNHPDTKDDATITCLTPDLKVEKTADDASVSAGSAIGFTITTTNNGPGTAKSVTLNDPLPNGVTWSIDPANADCAITGTGDDQELDCTFGDLADDASESVHVTATTSFDACTTYDNEATAKSTNAPDAKDDATVTCLKPDLTVEKTADAATVNAGEAIGFTITTTNNGPGTAKSVTLNDPLPNGVTWSIDPANADCAITGTGDDQELDCTFGDLADDASESVHITATTAFDACTVYNNEATAKSTNHPDAKDDATVACDAPDLDVVKTADDASVSAGSAIGFTITTTNNGPGTAKGVTLNDPLPNGVTWSISPANADCAITGTGDDQELDCTFGDLADDASRSVHVTATTSFDNCTTYDNEATAKSTNAPDAKDDASVTCLKPDLKVEKTADAANVNAGESIGFTITTTNNGPGSATGVTLNDPLPNGVTWSIDPANTDCAITGTGDDQELDCTFGNLADDASRTVHVTATTSFDNCTTYDNEATASSTNHPDAKDDATVQCLKPDLKVEKTADAATVDAGDPIGFTVKVTNNGAGTAKAVTVNDPLPNGVDWTIDPANADCQITGTGDDQVLTCDFGPLAEGESGEVHIKATTTETACTTYDNEATASSTNHPDAKDDATITCNTPDLGVDKAALKVTVDAGDDISFDITTSNAGPGTAKGVTLNDPLPEGVTWSITSQPAGNPAPCEITTDPQTDEQTLTCSFGDLPAGENRKVTVSATTSFEQCTVYNNTATADATNAPEKTDSATITCQKPDVSLEKKATKATVDAGDPIEFTITATNSGLPGTGNAKSVVIKDDLPGNDGADWSIVSPLSGCAISGAVGTEQLTCDPINLAPGESYDVVVSSQTAYDKCGVYDNTATFSPYTAPQRVPAIDEEDGPVAIPNGNAGSGESNEATITCLKPDLKVEKTADAATVDAGQDVGFTITTTNDGPGAAKGVTLKDELPNGLTWSIDPANADCAITGTGDDQVLDCTFGDMADEATKTVHVKATTSFENCTTYDNTATAKSTNHPDVSNGASTRCRQPATVRIDKIVEGETESETKFGFTSDLSPNAGDQSTSFELADVDPQKVYTVRPGTYQVTETDPRGLGYVLTSASCAPTEQQPDFADRKNTNNPEDGKVAIELAEGADVTCTFVNTKLTSGIDVVKSPKTQAVYLDGTATYTYKVTNTGSSDLTNVTATDDKCSPLTRTDAGNNDAENLLEQGETWTYTCSVAASTLFGTSTTPITNTVTASGLDRKETKVQDTDTAVTTLLVPGIALDKTGPATATAGELITYDLAVTNTGNTSFAEGNVKLTDTVVTGGACATAPTTPKDKKGDTSPGELNPGETWVYQCQVQTKVGDTKVTNKGDVSGTDTGGKTVSATDTAETVLSAPASNVSPAAAVSGRARLTGTVGCASAKYSRAIVTGSNIKQVTFYVNGKKVKTLTKPNSGKNYQLRYRTSSLKYGTYKVRATVQFVTGATPRSRNLNLQFNRCRPRVIKPKFTG